MIEGKNVKNGNVKCMRKKDFSEDEERKKKSDVKKYKITINSREMQSVIFKCQKRSNTSYSKRQTTKSRNSIGAEFNLFHIYLIEDNSFFHFFVVSCKLLNENNRLIAHFFSISVRQCLKKLIHSYKDKKKCGMLYVNILQNIISSDERHNL